MNNTYKYAITEIGEPLAIVRADSGRRSRLASDGSPAGAVFCNCVAICVPGAIADPLVAILIDPLTGPPVGSATGTGAGVEPAGTGVAGGSVATAATVYGVDVGIGTGVCVGATVGVADGPGVEGVIFVPPPPPHPDAATHNADIRAMKTNACFKAISLRMQL